MRVRGVFYPVKWRFLSKQRRLSHAMFECGQILHRLFVFVVKRYAAFHSYCKKWESHNRAEITAKKVYFYIIHNTTKIIPGNVVTSHANKSRDWVKDRYTKPAVECRKPHIDLSWTNGELEHDIGKIKYGLVYRPVVVLL